jgi:hypothetical protein
MPPTGALRPEQIGISAAGTNWAAMALARAYTNPS